MHFKYDQNLLLLWLFFLFQLFVLASYLTISSTWSTGNDTRERVKFLPNSSRVLIKKLRLSNKSYYDSDTEDEIYLETERLEDYFDTVNDTVCFRFGTDFKYMKRKVEQFNLNRKCECLPGYHGNDCSFPEVLWRAFIAFRQGTVLQKRSRSRRIIHMFVINHPAQVQLAAIKINELFDTVDLFIVAESNATKNGEEKPFHFKLQLDNGLCQDKQHKILFTGIHQTMAQEQTLTELSWKKSIKMIKNLREDDLFMQMDSSEIPNSKALLFFKLYDGFSLPVRFRLKWNVYGYFYQHPFKAKIVSTGSTIKLLKELYSDNPYAINRALGLTIGDLNHYGGWYCELCYDIKDIASIISTSDAYINISQASYVGTRTNFVESVMGDGLYIDGKTVLLNNHEGRDKYYAPEHVINNYWQYGSLMINMFNKNDYN